MLLFFLLAVLYKAAYDTDGGILFIFAIEVYMYTSCMCVSVRLTWC